MYWEASCDGIESWVLQSIYSEIQSEIVYVGVNKYCSTDRCSYPPMLLDYIHLLLNFN